MNAPPLPPGTTLGNDYEVVRPLAAGGMGAVYEARQRSTRKLRALKVMLPELVADAAQRARFAREASVGAEIESDHVVEVIAAGVDEASGLPWIAMEMLSGSDLARAVKARGVLPRGDVREVVRQLGHALAAAHRVGVVHRDLKPENIFLATARRDDVAFTLKVLDFGIARLVHAARTHATTGAIGSPLWMSPEQTESSATVTPATDVWAFGLLVFWAFTGRYYWRTPEQPDASIAAMLREIVIDPLPPASVRAAALGCGQALPAGFDEWFARCVARDPAARFAEAGAAAAELLRLLDAAERTGPPAAPPSLPDTRRGTTSPALPATGGAAPAGEVARKPPAARARAAAIAAGVAAVGTLAFLTLRPGEAPSPASARAPRAAPAAVANDAAGSAPSPALPAPDAARAAPPAGADASAVVGRAPPTAREVARAARRDRTRDDPPTLAPSPAPEAAPVECPDVGDCARCARARGCAWCVDGDRGRCVFDDDDHTMGCSTVSRSASACFARPCERTIAIPPGPEGQEADRCTEACRQAGAIRTARVYETSCVCLFAPHQCG